MSQDSQDNEVRDFGMERVEISQIDIIALDIKDIAQKFLDASDTPEQLAELISSLSKKLKTLEAIRESRIRQVAETTARDAESRAAVSTEIEDVLGGLNEEALNGER